MGTTRPEERREGDGELGVGCPRCNAEAGSPCTFASAGPKHGRRLAGTHRARVLYALGIYSREEVAA